MPLLNLLSDGKFHSGVELGEALGVSRSAIWKRLKTLEEDFGVEVFKVPGRGYRLEEPLFLLDAERIARQGGWPVTVLASIDSTNAEAQRRLHQHEQPPFVLLAEHQQGGCARLGQRGDQGFVAIDDAGSDHVATLGQEPPLDQAVTTIEFKNHDLGSGSIRHR